MGKVKRFSLALVAAALALATPSLARAQTRLFTGTANGSAVVNTTTPTDLLPATHLGGGLVGANSYTAGTIVWYHLEGIYSTAVLAPNLTIAVKWGSTTMASATLSSLLGGASNQPFSVDLYLTVFDTGATGHVMPSGAALFGSGGSVTKASFNTTSAVVWDTTTDAYFTVPATWSAASASSSVQVTQAYAVFLPNY